MADAGVGSGLMAHQKDEHDIWVCKDCGWKYPNAKPSPKIRKNHKKHCPGKAGTPAHAPGGSSDDASDDDHHPPVKGRALSQPPVPNLQDFTTLLVIQGEKNLEMKISAMFILLLAQCHTVHIDTIQVLSFCLLQMSNQFVLDDGQEVCRQVKQHRIPLCPRWNPNLGISISTVLLSKKIC